VRSTAWSQTESPHLSPDDIAELIERGPDAGAGGPSIRHLSRCEVCMAHYSESVRDLAEWTTAVVPFEDLGLRERRSQPSRGWWAGALVAAGFLIVAGGLQLTRSRPPAPSPAAASVLELASARDLVIPGGEAGAASDLISYRSGPDDRRAVERVVDDLREAYERGPRTSNSLYELSASLVATGRTHLAEDYIAEARALDAADPRFLVLDAILARQNGDTTAAVNLLREARRRAPRDATVALDLGMVLSDAGLSSEATALLREVMRRAPGSPLAARADRVLKEPSGR